MPKAKPKSQDKPVTSQEFSEFATFVGERFEGMERTVDERFTALDKRINTTFGILDHKIDEKFGVLDRKIDEKFDTVITKLDGVMHELQAHRDEDVVGARQLHRHDDQLLNHEKRIATVERKS
jgi:uncharacterized protein with von Willebrand factor type A (vWA) domain